MVQQRDHLLAALREAEQQGNPFSDHRSELNPEKVM
jgi:hypothetical protein